MIDIPVYYKDGRADGNDDDIDLDSEGVWIACDLGTIKNFTPTTVFMYSRDDGTFFIEINHKNYGLSRFPSKDVPIEYWRSFLETIFEEAETIKNTL